MKITIDTRPGTDYGGYELADRLDRAILHGVARELHLLGAQIKATGVKFKREDEVAQGDRVLKIAKEIRWLIREMWTVK